MRQNINRGRAAPTTPSSPTPQLDNTIRAAIQAEVRAAPTALVPNIAAEIKSVITTPISQLITPTLGVQ